MQGVSPSLQPFSGNYEVVSARFKPGETLVLVYLTQLRQKDMKVTSNVQHLKRGICVYVLSSKNLRTQSCDV